jgi:hypothetical protein
VIGRVVGGLARPSVCSARVVWLPARSLGLGQVDAARPLEPGLIDTSESTDPYLISRVVNCIVTDMWARPYMSATGTQLQRIPIPESTLALEPG